MAANTWVKTSATDIKTFSDGYGAPDSSKAKNSRSIGLLVTFGNFRYFVGGDLEDTQEDPLAKYLKPLDVLRTSHHGSNESSSKDFLKATKPAVAIISCGWGVRTGLSTAPPNEEAIKRMENKETDIYHIFFTNDPWAGQNKEVIRDRLKIEIAGDESHHSGVTVELTNEEASQNRAKFRIRFFSSDSERKGAKKEEDGTNWTITLN